MRWAAAFVLTLLCELPVYVLALRRPLGGTRRALAAGALANLATHPAAWLAATGGGASWVAIELAVTAVEAMLIFALARAWARRVPLHEALLVALAANSLSAGVGLIVL